MKKEGCINPVRLHEKTAWVQRATIVLFVGLTAGLLVSCGQAPAEPIVSPPALAEELIFYDWEDDMPQSVLDAFTAEYGVQVNYMTYETQDEALDNIRAGEIYDVVVLDNDYILNSVEGKLLAELDFSNIPNFKNIAANFRDLAYDPGNKHSVPWNWGTTGLLVRTDLLDKPITRWADLWETDFRGKIGMRDEPRDQLGAALKALGYSVNTENPAELQAALNLLLSQREKIVIVDSYADASVPMLLSGEIVALVGWAEDVLEAQQKDKKNIAYILPEEGPMLWGDNFVIPANSPRKFTAETFLNFVLRPEISAMIVNENYYACANGEVYDFLDPEIRDDPVIFPTAEDLNKAAVYLSLSAEGQALYEEIWETFKSGGR